MLDGGVKTGFLTEELDATAVVEGNNILIATNNQSILYSFFTSSLYFDSGTY